MCLNPRILLALAVICFPLAWAAEAPAQTTAIVSFGSGTNCSFHDLQEAIDAVTTMTASERIVRLERGVFEDVAVQIESDQVTLVGGFNTCEDEEPAPNARTILFGVPDDPVIFHQGLSHPQAGEPPSLRVRQIELGESGSGGLIIVGPARVSLEDVLILGNSAPAGAGIFVQAFTGFVDLRLERTQVNGNQTTTEFAEANGGGLSCLGAGFVQVESGSTFIGNKAATAGRGGGIYSKGCFVLLLGDVEISSNEAHLGGGIALTNGGTVDVIGDFAFAKDGTGDTEGQTEGDVEIRFNRAMERDGVAGQGGGVHLDEASEFRATAARIDHNRALPLFGPGESGGAGGGIYVDGADLHLVENSDSCEPPCLSLSANEASRGAALVVTAGSQSEVVRAFIEANVSDTSVLDVEDGQGDSSLLFLGSSVITRNAAPTLLRVQDRSSLELVHVSIGGNLGLDQAIQARDLSSLAVQSSLIFEPSADLVVQADEGVSLTAECSLLSDDSVLGGGPSVEERDPLFRDALTGDLHLLETSPAIDFCPVVEDLERDIDRQPRPVDQELVPDNVRPADAGADEVPLITPLEPAVFGDSFESGDLSAWGAVTQ